MANLLEDLLAYIHVVDTTIVAGVNSWYDTMPNKPDFAVSVYEVDGMPIVNQIAGASRKVTIVVRDAKTTVAKPLCNKIFKSLITENSIIKLTTDRWATVCLLHPPRQLKVDENQRVYYSFSAIFTTYID